MLTREPSRRSEGPGPCPGSAQGRRASRALGHRDRGGGGARGGLAPQVLALQRAAGNRAVASMLAPGPGKPPTDRRILQRSLLGSISEGISEAAGIASKIPGAIGGAVEAVVDDPLGVAEDLGSRAQTALDLAKYPACEPWTLSWKPSRFEWLDNEGLETIRHQPGQALSKTRTPSGGDKGATSLIQQAVLAWGCDTLGLDLLPKYGAAGGFGPETAAAVRQLQLLSGLKTDGVVGPRTLSELDRFVGVETLGGDVWEHRPTPETAGGTAEKGASYFKPHRNPVGRIFFATDADTLDAHDDAVLDRLADQAGAVAEKMTLLVVGYADKRENAAYNEALSKRRAEAVRERLNELLADRGVEVTTTAKAQGEIERAQYGETAEHLKPFRRADIHVEEVAYRKPPKPAVCTDTTTTEWQARLENVGTLGGGFSTTTMQVHIRTRHPDAEGRRWKVVYLYGGGGFGIGPKFKGKGLPGGVGIDSGWTNFTTSVPLNPTQFSGSARYGNAGAVLGYGANAEGLWMFGVQEHGSETAFAGWAGDSTGYGLGVGIDFLGKMRIYKTCEEMEASEG